LCRCWWRGTLITKLMVSNNDRVALYLPGQAVASLETLSLMESFLGIASALFRFCRVAMHNKSPGSLCHVIQAYALGYMYLTRVQCWRHNYYLTRVPCLIGLVCTCGVACPGI
jgi:hypothetical protein